MNKIGLFYCSPSSTTKQIAERIFARWGEGIDLHEVRFVRPDLFRQYDALILGTPTWDANGAEDDMNAFVEQFDGADFRGKRIALFGVGDQRLYPEAFLNAMGSLYRRVVALGAEVVGHWPANGYDFQASTALVGGYFVGLALDQDNQSYHTGERIDRWVHQLRGEFAGEKEKLP